MGIQRLNNDQSTGEGEAAQRRGRVVILVEKSCPGRGERPGEGGGRQRGPALLASC